MIGGMDVIKPFSNGTQYLDWQSSNCERCKKYRDDFKDPEACPIDLAIGEASVSDGKITNKMAKRMGYDPNKYVWRCGEVEWTDEWKAEWKKRHPEAA